MRKKLLKTQRVVSWIFYLIFILHFINVIELGLVMIMIITIIYSVITLRIGYLVDKSFNKD